MKLEFIFLLFLFFMLPPQICPLGRSNFRKLAAFGGIYFRRKFPLKSGAPAAVLIMVSRLWVVNVAEVLKPEKIA